MSLRRSARTKAATTELVNADQSGSTAQISKKRQRPAAAGAAPKTATKKVKTTNDDELDLPEPNGFKVPSTPERQRSKKPVKPPPVTPTPALVKVIAPCSSGDIDDATPPPLNRPVGLDRSAATLVTPGGTQHTAYNTDVSPTKNGLPRPTTTTGTVLSQALEHLRKVDPRMIPVIEKHHCHIFSPEGLAEEIDPFRSLASGIMAQQVSGAAANSIKNKFVSLFHNGTPGDGIVATFPTPSQVVETDITKLRTAGLSQRKAEYIQGLAQKFRSGELSTPILLQATDEEIMSKLIAVRGLGRWSVEMFACFGLKRMDVFSTGDLGVQRGMAAFIGRDVKKMKAKGGGKWKYMSEKEMESIAEGFRPYRSLFMWYMWRVEDVSTEAMENA